MFEFFFNSIFAYQQVAALLAALFCFAIGGAIIANSIYWRLHATRVEGTVIGVRQKGKVYRPVYSYMLQTGETFEATSDSGSNIVKGKETGRIVPLLVFTGDPLKVRPAENCGVDIFGLFFLAAAFGLGYMAFYFYPVNAYSLGLLTLFLFWGAMRFRKYIIPKEQRLSPSDWKSQRREKRQAELAALPIMRIEDIMSSPEKRTEHEMQRKSGRFTAPVVLLFALGLFYAAYDHYGRLSRQDSNLIWEGWNWLLPTLLFAGGTLLLLLFLAIFRSLHETENG